MSNLPERLRVWCNEIRRGPTPLKYAIPLAQQAADEIERLARELTEARDGIKEVMTDHAATLERLDEALQMARKDKLGRSCGYCEAIEAILTRTDQPAGGE